MFSKETHFPVWLQGVFHNTRNTAFFLHGLGASASATSKQVPATTDNTVWYPALIIVFIPSYEHDQ